MALKKKPHNYNDQVTEHAHRSADEAEAALKLGTVKPGGVHPNAKPDRLTKPQVGH